jgi:5-methylcytosine-specific restriction endonuclease McrA
MGIENKLITLRLNKAWQVIGTSTIKDAIIAMNSTSDGEKNAALALDIEYSQKENGDWDFQNPIYINPVTWSEWLTLKVRDFDFAIHTSKLTIRCPTVIIAVNYNKVPIKKFRATNQAILERDNYTCQYSGRKLSRSKLNIDHVIPKDKGGVDSWTNMVACDKDINFLKGNKLNEELGLKLIREPKEPLPTPISTLIREAKHPTWLPFLIK